MQNVFIITFHVLIQLHLIPFSVSFLGLIVLIDFTISCSSYSPAFCMTGNFYLFVCMTGNFLLDAKHCEFYTINLNLIEFF